ncbi:anamorsin homolog [Magnolia sinica]|uniref:anamorsin homolog n=1 Tax=Magnolia sinica TaxID=86752 RepID=UPI002657F6D8|nr:anamorsin homolog [Magnolia sinica]XP_058097943.1 anamorsin homolog [Magnolia sinica]
MILLQTPLSNKPTDEPSFTHERKLLLTGFVEAQVLQVKPFVPLVDTKSFTIRAKKPSWEMGSSFSIKTTANSLPKVQIDDDSDLIDEDSFPSDEDLKKPQLPLVGDCEVGGKRKACKNCTCGLAEAVEKVQKLGLIAEQLNNPQSACGNCGLGDAFRCSGCPYKGLPLFKLGEKVSLPGNFLAADI